MGKEQRLRAKDMEIKRDGYLNALLQRRGNGMVKVITGLRRSGKSYLLFEVFVKRLLEEGVREEDIVSITLDDTKSLALRNPLSLAEYIEAKTGGNRYYYVLIDEIQFCRRVKNPYLEGDFVTFYDVLNGLLRRKNVDVYVTGSNSNMLSSDVLTEFRGRGDELRMHPLSFAEYFDAVNTNSDTNSFGFSEAWRDYMVFGGLPQAVLEKIANPDPSKNVPRRQTYLKRLWEEVYLRDIVQRNRVGSEENLKDLMRILASSVGSYTNPSNIEKTFRSTTGRDYNYRTICSHISMLEDAFLIHEAKRFDIRGRKYIGANSKYYYEDPGIRNAALNNRQIDEGHLMENVIYNELLLRGFSVDVGIVERRDAGPKAAGVSAGGGSSSLEVDFIASKGSSKYYIQSSATISGEEKRHQEVRPLNRVRDSFRKILIVNENTAPWQDENGILTLSLRDFLLNPESLLVEAY